MKLQSLFTKTYILVFTILSFHDDEQMSMLLFSLLWLAKLIVVYPLLAKWTRDLLLAIDPEASTFHQCICVVGIIVLVIKVEELTLEKNAQNNKKSSPKEREMPKLIKEVKKLIKRVDRVSKKDGIPFKQHNEFKSVEVFEESSETVEVPNLQYKETTIQSMEKDKVQEYEY